MPDRTHINSLEVTLKSRFANARLLPLASAAGMALSILAPSHAQATVIDFATMSNGSVSVIGDATFSLAGEGEMGSPTVDSAFGGGLWNSNDGPTYATNTILRVDFGQDVTGVRWTFDNEGSKTTTFTLYDAGLNVLADGVNNTTFDFQSYDFSGLKNVRRIEWNNNGNDWLFAVGRLEYTVSSVPEPSTVALFGIGMLGAFAFRRRQQG